MPLPSVQGYLLGTRQPMNYVEPALKAYLAVSQEMRARQQQMMSDLDQGQQQFLRGREETRRGEAHEQDMIDAQVNRQITLESHQMEKDKFGLMMEEEQFRRDHLRPLDVEMKRAQLDGYRLSAESKRFELASGEALRRQFATEARDLNQVLMRVEAGPQEGQEADDYYESVRQANALMGAVDSAWSDADDPAVKGFLNATKTRLRKVPGYRWLESRGDLMTADQREAMRASRETAVDAAMPFRSDADRDRWFGENQKRFDAWMKLPDDQFEDVLKTEAGRVASDERYHPKSSQATAPVEKPVLQSVTQSDRDLLLQRNAAAMKEPGGDDGRIYVGEDRIPIEVADQMLRGLGFNDSHLVPSRQWRKNDSGMWEAVMPTDTGNAGIPRAGTSAIPVATDQDGDPSVYDPFSN